MGESSPAQYVEQYLLFDPTEFIKHIGNIGTIATIELVFVGEPLGELGASEIFEGTPPMADGTLSIF